jgi:hypothetical protein
MLVSETIYVAVKSERIGGGRVMSRRLTGGNCLQLYQ